MPFSQKILFKCTNCIYREFRVIGDCRPDINELKPCPICGSRMKMVSSSKDSLLDKVFKNLNKIFKNHKIL